MQLYNILLLMNKSLKMITNCENKFNTIDSVLMTTYMILVTGY